MATQLTAKQVVSSGKSRIYAARPGSSFESFKVRCQASQTTLSAMLVEGGRELSVVVSEQQLSYFLSVKLGLRGQAFNNLLTGKVL